MSAHPDQPNPEMTTTTNTARGTFVARFGENQATAIEEAGRSHLTNHQWSLHATDEFGTQPFKYWFLLCIGYECVTSPEFRDEHGITAEIEQMRAWAKAADEGNLAGHDGEVPDYLTFAAGYYNDWVTLPDSETQHRGI